jgi:hypothetical protein
MFSDGALPMSIKSIALLAVLAIVGPGAQPSSGVSAPRFCSFEYTQDIQDNKVLPILKQKFGEGFKFFNYEDPFIVRVDDTVQLRLRAVKSINGARLLDENPVVIAIDPCSTKVVRSYIINEYQLDD